MRRMEASELSDHLQSASPLLLDVREPWEFEICHLPNSVNIPMNQIPQQLDLVRAAEECVVICHHGVRSMQVINFLIQQSCNNLINLDGGVNAWAHQVDQDMALY
ncbi:MAG: rhodanese-like domain-containing protein [Gammaproteobacteria bacterium]|nr:rhodanese-like domain-containing protein [Gammaproteobacteria bacterium]